MKNQALSANYEENETTPFETFLEHTNQKRKSVEILMKIAQQLMENHMPEHWVYTDIGCGFGEISGNLISILLQNYPELKIKTILIDPEYTALKSAEHKLPTLLRLDYELVHNKFEMISDREIALWEPSNLLVSIHSLYHMENLVDQIYRIAKMLRPDGKACFALQSKSSQVLEIKKIFMSGVGGIEDNYVFAEDLEKILTRLNISFSSEFVFSELRFPVADVLRMPVSIKTSSSSKNIAFNLTKFYAVSGKWHLASTDLLTRIQRFYLDHRHGDEIILIIKEKFFYCDNMAQLSR